MKLIPFDRQKALAGEPICYRNGEVPLEWHYFEKKKDMYKIMTVDKNSGFNLHKEDGHYLISGTEHPLDLFMLPKKKTLWYCVYQTPCNRLFTTNPGDFASADDFNTKKTSRTILDQHTIEVEE